MVMEEEGGRREARWERCGEDDKEGNLLKS